MLKRFKEWIVRNYLQIINWVVLVSVYAINQNVWIETIVGLWIFFQIALAMWKWFKKSSSR